jgi:uncharacterized membrane protein
VATLIAISYPDETSAAAASEEALRRAGELVVEPDGIAVIVRDGQGDFHVTTNHQDLETGARWGVFWRLLFGALFFDPGATSEASLPFRSQLRDHVEPRTSALFLIVSDVTTDNAIDALARYGGTALTSPISTAPTAPGRARSKTQAASHPRSRPRSRERVTASPRDETPSLR